MKNNNTCLPVIHRPRPYMQTVVHTVYKVTMQLLYHLEYFFSPLTQLNVQWFMTRALKALSIRRHLLSVRNIYFKVQQMWTFGNIKYTVVSYTLCAFFSIQLKTTMMQSYVFSIVLGCKSRWFPLYNAVDVTVLYSKSNIRSRIAVWTHL